MGCILSINPYHNGSVCILKDGEVVLYLEEERLSRIKYDELPFKSILQFFNQYEITDIVIAGIGQFRVLTKFLEKELFYSFFEKFKFPVNNIHYIDHEHHLCHASCAFYNSGFSEAIAIIIDAGGAVQLDKPNLCENDTIFYCSYPDKFKIIKEHKSDGNIPLERNPMNIGVSFENLCLALGFRTLDGGKIMGLSSYGNKNSSLPELFIGNTTDTRYINYNDKFKNLIPENYPKDWHYDSKKVSDLEKDVSLRIQKGSEKIVENYVRHAIAMTNTKNVVVAGGYGLNCVANYHLKKTFPDVNFYFEPLSHDGGTSIGAAKIFWHTKTKDTTIRKQDSVYYGPKYSEQEILGSINKFIN